MKGKICDGSKGLLFFSILMFVLGIACIIVGIYIEILFLIIGIGIIIVGMITFIPYEYINGDLK